MDNRPPKAQASTLANLMPVPTGRANMGQVLHRCVQSCAGLLILLGVAVLLAWLFDIEAIKSVMPGHVGMKANTAIGFLASGVALLTSVSPFSRATALSRLFASIVLLIGAGSLCEYLLGVDLHVDQVLFHDTVQAFNPGRMAFVSCIAFCLSGLSLLLLSGGRVARPISQGLALLVAALAFASITGYLYGVPILYGSFANANTMALHTGAGFLILSCGIIVGRTDSTIGRLLSASERGSRLTRRILPALIVLPVLLGYVYLRPAVNLGQLRFGMALFAVTLALTGTLSLVLLGTSLNRAERQQREMMQMAMEAATAIEISEQELRLITDNLPTLIAYIDTSEKFLRVNRTYESWLGLAAEKIVGRTVQQVLGNNYWERTRPAREAARRGVTSSIETPYPTIYGDRRAIVTYAPDIDGSAAVRGFAVMVVDVEDQRKTEAALRQNEKLAAVGRLSSSIAHEINNPVDAAMNLIYLAREQIQDEEARSLLDIADGELKRVASIANETLRFQKQGDRKEPTLAADLFHSVLVLHSRRIRNNRIQVERRERASEPFECLEGQIRQVLNNLVANALDAMPPGGRLMLRSRPAIDWSSGRRGVALTVADDGAGMNSATLAHVCEAFFTTKGIGGNGLGLWISSEILTRHGGHMRIRTAMSEGAHGSIFLIFIPSSTSLPETPASNEMMGVSEAEDQTPQVRGPVPSPFRVPG